MKKKQAVDEWVQYVDQESGAPYWHNAALRRRSWDPPPPPRRRDDNDEDDLLDESSDGKGNKPPALKGVAKLKAAAEQSKKMKQDCLVLPPTTKRQVDSNGAVGASAETVPAPATLKAVDVSFDPNVLTLNDKKVGGRLISKGLKSRLLDIGLSIVRPEQPTVNLRLDDLKIFAREQLDEWHKRDGTLWTDSAFIKTVKVSKLARERAPRHTYKKRAMEKAASDTGDEPAAPAAKKPKRGKIMTHIEYMPACLLLQMNLISLTQIRPHCDS